MELKEIPFEPNPSRPGFPQKQKTELAAKVLYNDAKRQRERMDKVRAKGREALDKMRSETRGREF